MSSYSSELSRSQEYLSFRSSVPLRKIVVDIDGIKVPSRDPVCFPDRIQRRAVFLSFFSFSLSLLVSRFHVLSRASLLSFPSILLRSSDRLHVTNE